MAEPARLVILHEGDNPTLGYFGVSIESMYAQLSVLRVDISRNPEDFQLAWGDVVVIMRYLNNAWYRKLQKCKPCLAGLIYFMDDDLLDSSAMVGLPINYVRKLKQKALRYRGWIKRYCSGLWVGANMLAEKYADLEPKLLNPSPPTFYLTRSKPVYVAYHGSTSHRDEIIWLYDVMAPVLKYGSNIYMEIFGDSYVSRLYRDLPHVSVIQAMSWPNYFAYTSSRRVDLFLVPLISKSFNRGRSYTKFFDSARLGAAGLYSCVAPYKDFVDNKKDGLLLSNEKQLWVDAILSLSENSGQREYLANNCKLRAASLIKKSYSDNILRQKNAS
ncbi:glycosyltransferase family 1 protein [Allopusillimonas soli]|uniref:Glycosyltransferase family 1 protein n=1 Tax=Allopusillimonas soli TaxID=659016 RepID=A0A853F9Z8_9BURK|nr:glycosyltransferase family 1 protein [Allopusillimonas soli]NYT36442.1 glycosyltransferase family 1 protein [Allopusillimonas soli]TEA74951.1 glycosyltransferase family 1 protein [Allopusillimonas soli]